MKHHWGLNSDACWKCGVSGIYMRQYGDPGCGFWRRFRFWLKKNMPCKQ